MTPLQTDSLEVTQIDREAAARAGLDLSRLTERDAEALRQGGTWDEWSLVQAFARHRLSAAPQSHGKPVAWMYERKQSEIESAATLIHRRRWSTEQARGWTESPLYAAPQSQAALVEAWRANISVMEGALQQIAGSHWERFGVDQTDIEELPDLSADEAMNLARAVLMDTATPPEPRETEL